MYLMMAMVFIGHSNLSTTLVYAYADTEMKRKAIDQATANDPLPRISTSEKYDINGDEVLRHLYGLKG